MRLSRAYDNGTRMLVRVDGAIARDMLDTPDVRRSLSVASSTYSESSYSPDAIDFVETGVTGTEAAPIDEL